MNLVEHIIIALCLLFPQSEAGWSSGVDNSTIFESPPEVSLFVYESVELELTLTTSRISPEDPSEEDFTCPIKLHAGNKS